MKTSADTDRDVLAAVFRSNIQAQNASESESTRFARMLGYVRSLILDGWGAPDAQFPQQCYYDHGPAIILRALADAYESPEQIVSDEVIHP